MAKRRKFRQADYAATERTQITLGEALPEGHLARFIVSIVKLLDLSAIYGTYSERGGTQRVPAYAPEVMLGLLLYGYATGVFIKEVMGFRQFSLRGLAAAAAEWTLVCLAYNLKRLHVLHTA